MRSRKFWAGALFGAVAAGLLGLLVAASGVIPMMASQEPGPIDEIGHLMWNSSVHWRAPSKSNPLADDPEAVRNGLEHYAEDCLPCHGAPDREGAEYAAHMLPQPPELWKDHVQHMSDGALFHVIEHGVRMTGMPAFGEEESEEEIWELVAAVRSLDSLTPEQEALLR